ncbi:MAG: aminoglycoside phosphotransferase family protein [Ignavibacteria bacterium]
MIIGSIWNPELESIFKKYFGNKIHTCGQLSSHGSERIILRLKSKDDKSAIGIINKDIKENRAFIEWSEHFRKFSLNVPEIYGISDDYKCYIMEDLGDLTFFKYIIKNRNTNNTLSPDTMEYYKMTLSELPKFQILAGQSINYNLCYQFNKFGIQNIESDLNYFKEMFLEIFYRKYNEEKLHKDLNSLKKILIQIPKKYFLYRDFQSRNIMIKNHSLYFIDYQSGRKGALQYDLASLLFDAKADVPQNIREELIDCYINEAKNYISVNNDEFRHYFWYFAIARILQAMGAYGYLGKVKKKKSFLESIPYAINNINMILNQNIEKNSLEYLREMFKEIKINQKEEG